MRSLIALILLTAPAWAQSVFPPAAGGSGSGDVIGPAGTSADAIPLYSGTSGKILKALTTSGLLKSTAGVASTVTAPSGDVVGTTDTQTLENKLLTLPGIAAYTVGTLPGSATTGAVAVVTDAASPGNCTTGGGTDLALCRWNGSAWVSLGGGGGGSGDLTGIVAEAGVVVSNAAGPEPGIGVDTTTTPQYAPDTADAPATGTQGHFHFRTDTPRVWAYLATDAPSRFVLYGDVLPSTMLPAPTTTTVGGVKRNAGSAGQYVSGIDTDGSLLYGTPAGGGGGSSTQNYSQSFTAQTSVVLAHNLGTSNVIVACYDGSDVSIGWNSLTINSTSQATVTFTSAQSGRCVVNATGGEVPYAEAFTSQTSVTVTGATHGKGRCDLNVTIWDGSSPRKRVRPDDVTCDDTSKDVVVTFANAQTGRLVIQ